MTNFRNYDAAELEFINDFNIIEGRNGLGKTSILEAIHFLCLSRSFKITEDRIALKWDASRFELEGLFTLDDQSLENSGIQSLIMIACEESLGKLIYIDGKKIDKFSQMIGNYPVVISAPEDVALVDGAPMERRRFLDIALSQLYPAYLKDLQDYRQILRQRNALLNMEPVLFDSLRPWNATLAASGARIIGYRMAFIRDFAPLVQRVYQKISNHQETIRMLYRTTILELNPAENLSGKTPVFSEDMLVQSFHAMLDKHRSREILRKTTLIGPHKDDLIFLMNNKPMREYGSQGQYKTLALAIKIAEYLFLSASKDRKPILLLDDVFSELDNYRRQALLDALTEVGQVFITTAQDDNGIRLNRPVKYFTLTASGIETRNN